MQRAKLSNIYQANMPNIKNTQFFWVEKQTGDNIIKTDCCNDKRNLINRRMSMMKREDVIQVIKSAEKRMKYLIYGELIWAKLT
jgi:hypothetical protein